MMCFTTGKRAKKVGCSPQPSCWKQACPPGLCSHPWVSAKTGWEADQGPTCVRPPLGCSSAQLWGPHRVTWVPVPRSSQSEKSSNHAQASYGVECAQQAGNLEHLMAPVVKADRKAFTATSLHFRAFRERGTGKPEQPASRPCSLGAGTELPFWELPRTEGSPEAGGGRQPGTFLEPGHRHKKWLHSSQQQSSEPPAIQVVAPQREAGTKVKALPDRNARFLASQMLPLHIRQ